MSTFKARQSRQGPRLESGFSMIEMLIASTIGLVMVTGMIAVFSGNKKTSDINSAMSNMQENARFAVDAIARDVRMAGFQGCIDINSASAVIKANPAGVPTTDLFASAATGSVVESANNWNPAPPLGFTIPQGDNRPLIGTHTLSLQFGSPVTSALSAAMTSATNPLAAPIQIASNPGSIRAGDLAIISNCDGADLFRVSTAPVDAGQITHTAADNSNNGNLSRAYGSGATLPDTKVMKFVANIYYVGETGQQNEHGDPITALYQQSLPYDGTNPPTELVQGIENMRVRFGIRQPNGSLQYFTADHANFAPDRVESIQLGMLMSSWDRVQQEEDNKTYVLAGQTIPPGATSPTTLNGVTHAKNRRYRLAFNTTIKIRNRRDKQL